MEFLQVVIFYALFFACKLRYRRKLFHDEFIASAEMGQGAIAAIFYTAFGIAKFASAIFPKGIEGAKAEKAVKLLSIRHLVAGEIGASSVLGIIPSAFFHLPTLLK